jgi:DNA (cytosine-5)-methyltransferase 1
MLRKIMLLPKKDECEGDAKSPAKKFSVVDLFAGSGGLSLGFRMSGFFEPVAAVELNPVAAETYKQNLGVEVINRDVAVADPNLLIEIAAKKGYESIDAVIGGPPCRPFTTANKGGTRWEKVRERNRKNNENVENPEWLHFWRIVDAIKPKPRLVLTENVMGMKLHDDVFTKFVARLETDYVTCFRELYAHCFGVPQHRNRLFIAGIRKFKGNEDSLLPDNPAEKSIKILSVKDAFSDLPKLSNDSFGQQISNYSKGRPSRYESLLRTGSQCLSDHVCHSVHPVMAERFQYIPPGYSLRRAWAEKLIPETSMKSRYTSQSLTKQFSQKTIENMHSNIYRRLNWEDASCTITHVRKTVLIHPFQDRLISVREAARLQSFPDWFRFRGSVSQQYQQIADAVPPLLAKAIGAHLGKLLSANTEA